MYHLYLYFKKQDILQQDISQQDISQQEIFMNSEQ